MAAKIHMGMVAYPRDLKILNGIVTFSSSTLWKIFDQSPDKFLPCSFITLFHPLYWSDVIRTWFLGNITNQHFPLVARELTPTTSPYNLIYPQYKKADTPQENYI